MRERVTFVDPWSEIGRIPSERNIQLFQKRIHSWDQGLGAARSGFHPRCPVIDNHTVSQVGGHNEIVFDNECSLFGMHDEP